MAQKYSNHSNGNSDSFGAITYLSNLKKTDILTIIMVAGYGLAWAIAEMFLVPIFDADNTALNFGQSVVVSLPVLLCLAASAAIVYRFSKDTHSVTDTIKNLLVIISLSVITLGLVLATTVFRWYMPFI